MTVKIEERLELEADHKGLTGDKRTSWIGGAWNRIRGKEHRSSWRNSEEAKLLSRYLGPVHEVRQRAVSRFGLQVAKRHQDHVVLRQGRQWFDMPRSEYQSLIRASKKEAAREAKTARELARQAALEHSRIAAEERRAKAEKRSIAQYEKALALDKKREEQKAHQLERQEAAFKAQQERDVRRMEREQYSDVVAILKRSGGIRPSVSHQGTKFDRGEYDTLPSTVRSSAGGLTMDDAARNVNAKMPWLNIDTINDLVQYFDRHRTHGYTLHKAS